MHFYSPAAACYPHLDVWPTLAPKSSPYTPHTQCFQKRSYYPIYSLIIPQWQPSCTTYNVLPVSVLRKPFNSCMRCLANAVCFDGLLTDWPKQNSFYSFHFFFFSHSAVTEFNNVKGTTHAKIDVMMELAVVAFAAGCSSVQTHHIIADKKRGIVQPLPSRGRLKLWKGFQNIVRPTWPPLLISQSVKNNISHYIHGYRRNLSRMV